MLILKRNPEHVSMVQRYKATSSHIDEQIIILFHFYSAINFPSIPTDNA
jgi:hypothetical protein